MTHVGALKLHCLPTHCIKVSSPLETVLRAVLRSQLPGVSIPYTVERIAAKHEFKAKSPWKAPWQFLRKGNSSSKHTSPLPLVRSPPHDVAVTLIALQTP